MAATNAIYAQDGTQFLRSGYANDELWFEAAMGHGGADGCRLTVTPDSGGAYFAAGGAALFIDVPHDNIEVICAPGADFQIDTTVGGPTSLIRIVGKKNFKWRGGKFTKGGANVTTGQSFFSAAPSGSTNCDGFEIRDVEFDVASTSTALNNFQCINILGVASSEWVSRARRCVVDNCTYFARSVQQATALGTLAGGAAPTPYSQTRFGGFLLRSRHTSGLKVSGCGLFGDDGTTGGNWNASHWAGGMLWVQNDEGGSFTQLDAFGASLMATDGTGGTLVLIGDDGIATGEGGHFVLSDSTFHNIAGLFVVDAPKAQYSVIHGIQIGRCSADAMIHSGNQGGSTTRGDGLAISACDMHNFNRAVYSANGAIGTSAASTTKATGGYGIHLEYVDNVTVGPMGFAIINSGRMAFRADSTCGLGSIRFDATEHTWGFNAGVASFTPIEITDKRVIVPTCRHRGPVRRWTTGQMKA